MKFKIKNITLHVHPISAHFPNALFPIAGVLLVLYLIFGLICLEKAGYYCLVFGMLGSPVGMVSGLSDWKSKYKGVKAPLFLEKRRLSIILVILSLALVLIRTLLPELMTSSSSAKWIYLIFIFSLTLISGRLGYLGGKLVFK